MRTLAAALVLAASPALGPAQPLNLEAGQRLFQQACSACHGQNGGGGHGPSLVSTRRVRALNGEQLLEAIQKGVPGTDMPPSKLPAPQLKEIAAFVRSFSAPAIEAPSSGDPSAGRAIFFGKGSCANCHAIQGRGGILAPDLTDIGANRTMSQLQESLVQPNKSIVEGFEAVTVTLPDGRRLEGIAKNHDTYSIQILDTAGRLHLLSVADVAKIEFGQRSLMPDDFARRLSPEEMRDLLAFLSRLAIRTEGKQ